jgi:hypothetical protein
MNLRYVMAMLGPIACYLLAACINTKSERGVEAVWRTVEAGAFADGETTRGEVLELLGPPSQILSLEGETAFYYMVEKTHAKGLILIVYNDRKERTVYDRAVFFFDDEDVLIEHAFGE